MLAAEWRICCLGASTRLHEADTPKHAAQIEEPEVAFPQFVAPMQTYLARRASDHSPGLLLDVLLHRRVLRYRASLIESLKSPRTTRPAIPET